MGSPMSSSTPSRTAGAGAGLADLGSGNRDGAACGVDPGHGPGGVLRAPTFTVGAAHGLIREYLPKGIDITDHQPYLEVIADELNDRPRAVLGFRTPREALTELLVDSVACTG